MNFGLNQRFCLIRPEWAQISPIQCKSAQVYAKSVRDGKKKKKDAAPTRRQQRRLRVAASDAGAVAVLPRPCILAQNLKLLAALIVISFGKNCGS